MTGCSCSKKESWDRLVAPQSHPYVLFIYVCTHNLSFVLQGGIHFETAILKQTHAVTRPVSRACN